MVLKQISLRVELEDNIKIKPNAPCLLIACFSIAPPTACLSHAWNRIIKLEISHSDWLTKRVLSVELLVENEAK